MAGKKNRYIYQLYENGVLVDEGSVRYLADKYWTTIDYLYVCYRDNRKFQSRYSLKRHSNNWKPNDHDEYYYNSTNGGTVRSNFDKDNYLCLMHWFSGNCFQTETKAKEHKQQVLDKLTTYYQNT